MTVRKYRFIDLFAGAGGLSEGFVMNGKFLPIAHVEMNKDACYTLKTRAVFHYLRSNDNIKVYNDYQKGIISRDELYSSIPSELLDTVINNEISKNSINLIFHKIDKIIKSEQVEDLDLIVGGPPCQAYSLVGRAVSSNKMVGDPRNYLYKQYIKFIKHYTPKKFIFENVSCFYCITF